MRKLYRPVGVKELDLILNTGCRRYPKRLPTQPIFYPVLNQEYAAEIAKLWNTKDQFSGYAGVVTEFNINEKYFSCTVQFNWKTVTMNYVAWQNYDFKDEIENEEKQVLLTEIKNILKRNYKWFFVF